MSDDTMREGLIDANLEIYNVENMLKHCILWEELLALNYSSYMVQIWYLDSIDLKHLTNTSNKMLLVL